MVEDDEWWWQGWEEMAEAPEAPAAQGQGEKLISATFDLRDAELSNTVSTVTRPREGRHARLRPGRRR